MLPVMCVQDCTDHTSILFVRVESVIPNTNVMTDGNVGSGLSNRRLRETLGTWPWDHTRLHADAKTHIKSALDSIAAMFSARGWVEGGKRKSRDNSRRICCVLNHPPPWARRFYREETTGGLSASGIFTTAALVRNVFSRKRYRPSCRLLFLPQLEVGIRKVKPDVGKGVVHRQGPPVRLHRRARVESQHLQSVSNKSNGVNRGTGGGADALFCGQGA